MRSLPNPPLRTEQILFEASQKVGTLDGAKSGRDMEAGLLFEQFHPLIQPERFARFQRFCDTVDHDFPDLRGD
jgi:hypothetical protein